MMIYDERLSRSERMDLHMILNVPIPNEATIWGVLDKRNKKKFVMKQVSTQGAHSLVEDRLRKLNDKKMVMLKAIILRWSIADEDWLSHKRPFAKTRPEQGKCEEEVMKLLSLTRKRLDAWKPKSLSDVDKL